LIKAKLPVAKHHTSQAKDAWAGQVWTEELTHFSGNAVSVAQSSIAPYAQTSRLSTRIGL